jgi:hypothetical protein
MFTEQIVSLFWLGFFAVMTATVFAKTNVKALGKAAETAQVLAIAGLVFFSVGNGIAGVQAVNSHIETDKATRLRAERLEDQLFYRTEEVIQLREANARLSRAGKDVGQTDSEPTPCVVITTEQGTSTVCANEIVSGDMPLNSDHTIRVYDQSLQR